MCSSGGICISRPVVLVSYYYTRSTKRVGLVHSGHLHHLLIEISFALAMLTNCSFGLKEQLLTSTYDPSILDMNYPYPSHPRLFMCHDVCGKLRVFI